ncbi:MAG: hypothetical protein H0V76_00135 [Blastocatellia bacterium]|nr:hypothetical protein [Blastocatellia bacterium]
MNGKSPLEILIDEKEQINPAIILADELMRRAAAELLSVEDVAKAERVLEIGAREIEVIDVHRKAFLKSQPTPLSYVPYGF